MLLTDNNNVYVKEIAVLNGKQSRVWTTKEESARPNAYNESIIITAAIYSK